MSSISFLKDKQFFRLGLFPVFQGETLLKRSAMKTISLLRDKTLKICRKEIGFLAVLLISLFSVGEVLALQTLQMNLEGMARQSGRIVEGVVLSAVKGSVVVPGQKEVPVMEYTLSVSTVMKGKKDDTLVVRHIILPGLSDPTKGEGVSSGFPHYKVGEHLILFLTHESSIGLSSPVGLMQGVFQVQKGKNGESARVVNGKNNVGLFAGMSHGEKPSETKSSGSKMKATVQTPTDAGDPLPSQEGPVSYTQFMSIVNNIVSGQ